MVTDSRSNARDERCAELKIGNRGNIKSVSDKTKDKLKMLSKGTKKKKGFELMESHTKRRDVAYGMKRLLGS